MTFLAHVVAYLKERGISTALIGGGALMARGILRATVDDDLLALSSDTLSQATWRELAESGVAVDIRRGDAEDPLRGVVRLTPSDSAMPIDVVVGRYLWQDRAIERAELLPVDGAMIPVVTPLDLILLKLYAAAPQDLLDIQMVLADAKGTDLADRVTEEVAKLPSRSQRFWTRVREELAENAE